MIDPNTLTPESLYQLQSETWTQGAEHELSRITEIVNNFITPLCRCDNCKTARLIATAIKMSDASDRVDTLEGDDNGNN